MPRIKTRTPAEAKYPYCAGKKEAKKYAYLYENIRNPSLQQRARGSLHYFINKASFYKICWILLSSMSIALPAMSTYIAAMDFGAKSGRIMATISLTTTLATGYLALFKCADKKIFYRDAAESLKSEISSYLSAIGDYEKCRNIEEKNKTFAENLERLVKSSNHKIVILEREQQVLPTK